MRAMGIKGAGGKPGGAKRRRIHSSGQTWSKSSKKQGGGNKVIGTRSKGRG